MKTLNKPIKTAALFIAALCCFAAAAAVGSHNAKADALSGAITFNSRAASCRMTDPAGINFGAEISKEEYRELKDVYGDGLSFGTLICKAENADGGLTFGSAAVVDGRAVDVKNTVMLEEGDKMVFNAALVNVKEENYGADFTATAYVKAQTAAGAEYLYASPVTANFFSLAARMQFSDVELSEKQLAVIENVVQKTLSSKDGDISMVFPQDDMLCGNVVTPRCYFDGDEIKCSFVSSDSQVIEVRRGELIAKAAGSCEITALAGGKTAVARVTVENVDVTSLCGAAVESAADGVAAGYTRNVGYLPQDSVIGLRMSGSDAAMNSYVDVRTDAVLEKGKTYDFNFRLKTNALTASGAVNVMWGLNFSTSSAGLLSFYDLVSVTGRPQSQLMAITDWSGREFDCKIRLTPSADVDGMKVRICIHGGYYSVFDLTLGSLSVNEVIDYSGITGVKYVASDAGISAAYTADAALLPQGTPAGLAFTVNGNSPNTVRSVLQLLSPVQAGVSYKFSFSVKVTDNGGKSNYYHLINFSDLHGGQTQYKSIYSCKKSGSENIYNCEYTVTAASGAQALEFYVTMSPGQYDGLSFVLYDCRLTEI